MYNVILFIYSLLFILNTHQIIYFFINCLFIYFPNPEHSSGLRSLALGNSQ